MKELPRIMKIPTKVVAFILIPIVLLSILFGGHIYLPFGWTDASNSDSLSRKYKGPFATITYDKQVCSGEICLRAIPKMYENNTAALLNIVTYIALAAILFNVSVFLLSKTVVFIKAKFQSIQSKS